MRVARDRLLSRHGRRGVGISLFLCSARSVASAQAPETPRGSLAYRDTTCAACHDFYRFANGGWIAAARLAPGEQRRGVREEMNDRTIDLLRRILDSLVLAKPVTQSPEWKLAHFYASCLDSARIIRAGLSPLLATFARVDSLPSPGGVVKEIAALQRAGLAAPFLFSAD